MTAPDGVAPRRKCSGPVYFADQGIEVCETCDGCLCCEFVEVDHEDAPRRCFLLRAADDGGVRALAGARGHVCTPDD